MNRFSRQRILGEVTERRLAAVHEPEFTNAVVTGGPWEGLDREEFPDDMDLAEIAGHFLQSETGFPPDDFSDLNYPVVNPDGELRLQALEDAYQAAQGENDEEVAEMAVDLAVENYSEDELADEEWLPENVELQNLPADVEECAKSVKEDNPDMDKSSAIAICQSMKNKGKLADGRALASLMDEVNTAIQQKAEELADDGAEEETIASVTAQLVSEIAQEAGVDDAKIEDVMTGAVNCPDADILQAIGDTTDTDPQQLIEAAKASGCSDEDLNLSTHGECPDGQYMVDGECKDIEEVDAPAPILNSEPQVYQLGDIPTGPIERIEEGEDRVRYTNLKLISPGVWTDSASRETVWYSPEGMRNLEIAEDNVVNIMHDEGNDVSEAGFIDPESVEQTEDGVFADVVIETDNAAGEYADENLQQTLESQGSKGFGGPSVEIDAEGQQVEFNEEKGMRELVGGVISGVGLVKNPAAKSVSFARQTAQRGVALSDSQSVMLLSSDIQSMTLNQLRSTLSEYGIDVTDKDDAELMELAEALGLQDDEEDQPGGEEAEEGDDEEDTPEEEEREEGDDDEEEEEEDEETEMQERLDALEERLTNVEDMVESAMAAEDVEETLSEELSEVRDELAAAETAQELQEAVDGLEARLSELEEEPKEPKALSDGDGDEFEGSSVPASTRDYQGRIRR